MRKLIIIAFVALAACSSAKPIDWPAVVRCAGPVAGQLVEDVERIISEGGVGADLGTAAIAELEALAGKYGAPTIVCILEQLIESWMAPTGAPASGDDRDKAARAQGFLNAHEIDVVTP